MVITIREKNPTIMQSSHFMPPTLPPALGNAEKALKKRAELSTASACTARLYLRDVTPHLGRTQANRCEENQRRPKTL